MREKVYLELIRECEQMKKRIPILEREIRKAPQGSLRISVSKGKFPQYYAYLKEENNAHTNGKFIRKKEIQLAQKLAQKTYHEEVLKVVRRQVELMEGFLKAIKVNAVEAVYEGLSKQRRELVTPIVEIDERYVQNWKNELRGGMNSYPIMTDFLTENGEHVRSKSELILANKFYKEGIPYVYEPRIALLSGRSIYPDFALLDVRERKTYYWEHFGMMDMPEYSEKMVIKMGEYMENDYWPGDDLICTYETKENPLNLRMVDQMLKKYGMERD